MIIPLEHLTVIEVLGQNPDKFLQGQLTCDIKQVADDTPLMGALCNLKGAIIALVYVFKENDIYYLALPTNLIESVLKTLNTVARLSRITLNISATRQIGGIIEKNLQIMKLQSKSSQHTKENSNFLNKWHIMDIKNNNPWIYPETSELFSPFDLGLQNTNAVSFSKGCYRGQEIIARIHYLAKYKYQYATKILPKLNNPITPGQDLNLQEYPAPITIIDVCNCNDQEIIIGFKFKI